MHTGLWDTVDPVVLMRPMSVRVDLRDGTAEPSYGQWRKRLVLNVSLLGMRCQEEGGRLVIRARDGGEINIKQRARVLDWLLEQADVTEVHCDWPAVGEPRFSIHVLGAPNA